MSSISPHEDSKCIAILNDEFRTMLTGGSVYMTAGVQGLGAEFVAEAISAVRTFNEFSEGNDPYQEHDFGALTVQGHKLFWKIDYYDPSMQHGSENPCDLEITRRVLTVMLAEEY